MSRYDIYIDCRFHEFSIRNVTDLDRFMVVIFENSRVKTTMSSLLTAHSTKS